MEGLVLGIDGGGSKTAARLARLGADEPEEIGAGWAGPSNVRAVGIEHATTNLDVAIDAAFAAAGVAPATVDSAVLALAGSLLPDVRGAVGAWAERRGLAARVDIVHDADPVLRLGAGNAGGVALIVGTGSVAIGQDREGRRAMAGGWGFWFGDSGSGYDLGRQALKAVANAEDGLCEPTTLKGLVLQRLQVDEPREILRALGGRVDAHREIAALAKLVLDAADEGDAVAGRIVVRAAGDAAALVGAAARKLGFQGDVPLGIAGGVGASSDSYRRQLVAAVRSTGVRPQPVTVVAEPVRGCLLLAGERAVPA